MALFIPMSPILVDRLPADTDRVCQLKYDGFRILALVDNGRVELFSKRMQPKTAVYPELVRALSALKGTFLLDGEAVLPDDETGAPSFQRMQQRDKLTDSALIRLAAADHPVRYMLFDLLQLGQEDWRPKPFRERYGALQELAASWEEPLVLSDLYHDADCLWEWVCAHGWEGIVSKRLEGPYRSGKDHGEDWLKRKIVLQLETDIPGVIVKEGRVSSLVMRRNGIYAGRVSSGLSGRAKKQLLQLEVGRKPGDYFPDEPEGLRGTEVFWLQRPLTAQVTARELTNTGLLRHPKLLSLGGIAL
ncbi:DNA ligase [Paenibacillus sp. CC-CFT747]|nr:DNA ligase [Paenibacillus sp. CC-CFT747]